MKNILSFLKKLFKRVLKKKRMGFTGEDVKNITGILETSVMINVHPHIHITSVVYEGGLSYTELKYRVITTYGNFLISIEYYQKDFRIFIKENSIWDFYDHTDILSSIYRNLRSGSSVHVSYEKIIFTEFQKLLKKS